MNVAGLGLPLHVEGDSCWTELSLPDRFEGWQGIAHGGIVATILDEVMAWSLVDRDAWGLTARLSIDFRRPVPIGRRIRAEGRLEEQRRRLLRTSARLVDPDSGELLATAEGLYMAAPDERKQLLKRTYGFADGEQPPATTGQGPR
jgi:acyl-coenzyme A thioesterase PaaI-like protein